MDAGEDIVGGFGATERLWIGIGGLDIVFDRLLEFADRAEHAALESSFGKKGEEALLFLFASQSLANFLLKTGLPVPPLIPVPSSQAVSGAVLGIGF